MNVIKTAVIAALSAGSVLATPMQARAETCHTWTVCVNLIFVSGCYTYSTCDDGPGEENDTIE